MRSLAASKAACDGNAGDAVVVRRVQSPWCSFPSTKSFTETGSSVGRDRVGPELPWQIFLACGKAFGTFLLLQCLILTLLTVALFNYPGPFVPKGFKGLGREEGQQP